MNPERYIRQTTLREFGAEGQKKLALAKVLVVGAGGLGIPVLTYLNAMGVGTLGVVDNDVVSLTNLQRQVLYSENDIGASKVAVVLRKLKEQNSETDLKGYATFLTRENALNIIDDYDLIVDASDNFPTRYLVNDACVLLKRPFIYGALHGFEGQVSVFNYKGGPTYRCLFPKMPKPEEVPDCNENGVLGILPGIIGNLQALEAVKLITEVGEVLSGKLLLFNGLSQHFQKIKFSLQPENLQINRLRSDYNFECSTDVATIDSEAFVELLERSDIQVVDVRTVTEFRRFHLDQAINLPLANLEDALDHITFTKPVYLLCQSGIRSRKAVDKLRALRPDATLVNVAGGMNNLKVHAARN